MEDITAYPAANAMWERHQRERMPVHQAQDAIARIKGEATEAQIETIAEQFGYTSGSEMLQAVQSASGKDAAIEGMTDQRMLERYGELATPEAIELAANDAIHNEARARSLATELKAQAEMMNPREDTGRTSTNGRTITVNAITKAAKPVKTDPVALAKVYDMARDDPEAFKKLRMESLTNIGADMSGFASGYSRGSALGQMIADLAFNTKRKFFGDPGRYSTDGELRFPEMLLSSALKHGTTRHLEIDPRDAGRFGIEWGDNDALNARHLIDLVVKNIREAVPEVDGLRYNFRYGQFQQRTASGTWEPATESDFRVLRGRLSARGAAEAVSGRTTLQRAAYLHSLLREARQGVGTDVLAEISIRSGAGGSVAPALGGLFYSRADSQGPRGTFNPQTLLISLNENADLSTFLHESGHFYLEVLADLASQPDAPAQIREDMDKVLAWFGIKGNEAVGGPDAGSEPGQDGVFAKGGRFQTDITRPDGRTPLEVWNAMTLDQKRPYHERWAESFEQYLFEGKAPSVELQPIFRRFRSWLVNVYKSLAHFMQGRNLKLSDEIRQVMDRLIAADEQIAQAEEVAGMLPDFEATNEAVEKLTARSLRDLKWTIGARAKAIKALQKEAAGLRKAVEAEVRAEVEQMNGLRRLVERCVELGLFRGANSYLVAEVMAASLRRIREPKFLAASRLSYKEAVEEL